MTSKERNELVRLVKARFRLLKMQAKTRAYEIREREEDRLELEDRELTKEFRDRLDAINERAKPLFDEVAVVMQEAWDAGFRHEGYTKREYLTDVRFHSVKRYRTYDHSVEKHVLAEIERAEIAAIEEILMPGIEDEETAAKFLDRIPTIESLVSGSVNLAELGDGNA